MIVVEGPDGAGKTSLVEQIQKRFDYSAGVRGTNDRNLLFTVTRNDTRRALAEALAQDEEPKIWDRLFYSEFVYAPVVGRPCEFVEPELSLIQGVLDALMCPIILCMPPLTTVLKGIKGEKQMKGVEKNIQKIYQDYWDLFTTGPFAAVGRRSLWFDWTGRCEAADASHPFTGDLEDVFQHIEEYLELREARNPWNS